MEIDLDRYTDLLMESNDKAVLLKDTEALDAANIALAQRVEKLEESLMLTEESADIWREQYYKLRSNIKEEIRKLIKSALKWDDIGGLLVELEEWLQNES